MQKFTPYNLAESLSHWATIRPEKVAFTSSSASITYLKIEDVTSDLAQILVLNSIKKGDTVGICMPRCIASAVAAYGIWKAGAIMVPIDPKMPKERLNHIVFISIHNHL